MRHQRRRLTAVALAVAVIAAMAAACSSAPSGPPVLTWYINPDDGGQAEIAARCTAAAGGRYTIATSTLPRQASEQRQQLVRRLAANDSSIDIMSIDPPYVPEFAQAGFLAPMPPQVAAAAREDRVPSSIEASTWQGQLVVVPFWANTQLLWYRKSAVAAMGLDMNQPVTWDRIIQAAAQNRTQIAAQGVRGESLTVWVNALVESAGGSIITNVGEENPDLVQLGLTAPPGIEAARVLRTYGDAGVAPPGFPTADEDTNAESFQSGDASFMVNYPFIWGKAKSAVEEGTLQQSVPDDYGWTLYPRVLPDRPSAPPLGGINLGVGAFSNHPDLAYEATTCITSPENSAYYFVSNGNPSSRLSVFDDPEVLAEFPMAPTIRESLTLAAPRPQTAYYAEVSGGIQRTFHPPGSVTPGATNEAATALITAVLRKEALL
ncbi:carbohydrate ABC transporter substrate-binding protein (CUT1 family) [Actinomycetospora succinea]|uniref:Carbohydrate ABC transporter substrate-binding protein (CUT1 family) n=1 Tax=Actinomycetospora succinea TaxID=663603 RepID=A0A4R6VEB4_9PSEU|nr:extracellular solute-binding protein [Actinomycetospora succinea]TDQ61102.1 carbohydrate ABC transporter substrate-binding protein (CUT1 family) [Actinomycetospora succinea]